MTDSLTTKTCQTCLGTRRVLHVWDRPGGSPGNGWGPCLDCAETHPEIPGFVPVSIDPCLAKREPGEPMFILLARDSAAPAMLEYWCALRECEIAYGHRTNTEQERQYIAEVRAKVASFRAWRATHHAKPAEEPPWTHITTGIGLIVFLTRLPPSNACAAQSKLLSPTNEKIMTPNFQTTTLPKHEILFRDWKEQFDARDVDEAIQRVFDGSNAPRLYEADTGQDAYAIVVSSAAMTPEQVQAAWETDRG